MTRRAIHISAAILIAAALSVMLIPWDAQDPNVRQPNGDANPEPRGVLDIDPPEDGPGEVKRPDAPVSRFVPELGQLSIEGVVVDERGAAVTGAQVWLAGEDFHTPPSAAPPHETVASDAHGRFRFTDLAAGTLRVCCFADGYSPAQPVEVKVGEGDPQVVVSLSRGLYYHGRVLSSGGSPEPAHVRIVACDEDRQWETRCDENGFFLIEGLVDGLRFDLEVTAPVALAFNLWGVDFEELPEEIELRGGDLRIHVTPPPHTTAIDELECHFSRDHATASVTVPVVDGEASIHGLTNKFWDYRIVSPQGLEQSGFVSIRRGKETVLAYSPLASAVTVLVTDTGQSPVPGATVSCGESRCSVLTDENGIAKLTGLSTRGFALIASKDGHSPASKVVAAPFDPGTVFRMVLEETGGFRVTVRDEEGEPAGDVRILVSQNRRPVRTVREARDERGIFYVHELPLAEHTFSVRWSDLEVATFVDTPQPGLDQEVEIRVRKPWDLTCQVVRNGEVISGHVRGPDYSGRTAADGTFRCRVAGPGYYRFYFTPDDGSRTMRFLESVSSEGVVQLRYDTAEFKGRVLDADGKPLTSLQGALNPGSWNESVPFETDSNGEFSLLLATGTYRWKFDFGAMLSTDSVGSVYPDRSFEFPAVTEDTYTLLAAKRRKFRIAEVNSHRRRCIEDVYFYCIQGNTRTPLSCIGGEDGSWIVDWPQGLKSGSVRAGAYPPLAFELDPNADVQLLEMSPGGHLDVRVEDELGRGLNNCPVLIEPASKEVPHSPAARVPVLHGNGHVYAVEGTYWLSTELPSGRTLERRVLVVAGETRTVVLR